MGKDVVERFRISSEPLRFRINGIDYCEHWDEVAETGILPPIETISRCPVCLRKMRMMQASKGEWSAMPHAQVNQELMEKMAMQFLDGRNHSSEPEHKSFYTHLVECGECEGSFALAVHREMIIS